MTTQDEVRGLMGMLRSIAGIAEGASLTGTLRGGTKECLRCYNMALTRLQGLEILPGDMFVTLGEQTSMDEIGVASSLLAGYLKSIPVGSPKHGNGVVDDVLRKVDETMRNVFGDRSSPDKPGGTQEEEST